MSCGERGPLVVETIEEKHLREIDRLLRIIDQRTRRLKERGAQFRCNWCGNVSRSKKMTIHWNERTGEILFLCFRACQHFPEPFRDTTAGWDGSSQHSGWHRIDPWQDYKRPQLGLRKDQSHKVVNAPTRQLKMDELVVTGVTPVEYDHGIMILEEAGPVVSPDDRRRSP